MPLTEPTLLTCAYVLLNKPNLGTSQELQFNPQFVATLFDLPQSTGISSTPEGLVIAAPGKYGPRVFSFNPIKIQIQNDSPYALQQTAGRVFQHFTKIEFPLDPTAHGLNYEIELTLSGDESVADWLARTFVKPGLQGLRETPHTRVLLDSVEVKFENYGQLQLLRLQPRAGKPDKLFAYINLDFKPGRVMHGEHLESESSKWFDESTAILSRLLGV